MAARIDIDVPDVVDLIDDALELLRLERGSADTGPFVEVQTVMLDVNVTSYSLSDPGGTPGDWYRWRFSETDDSNPTAYRGPLVSVDAYATLTELLRTFGTAQPTEAVNLTRLATLLEMATREIDRELGWGFRPTTGTWRFRANGPIVQIPGGLVEVETVGVRSSAGAEFVETTDYDLLPEFPPPGEPYRSIRLRSPSSDWSLYPFGSEHHGPRHREVEITGTRGWVAPPADIRESVIARARQAHAGDPALSGGVPGWSDGPSPVPFPRLPDVMYRALKHYRAWQVIL